MDIFGWLERKFEAATVRGVGRGLVEVGVLSPGEGGSAEAVRIALQEHFTLAAAEDSDTPAAVGESSNGHAGNRIKGAAAKGGK